MQRLLEGGSGVSPYGLPVSGLDPLFNKSMFDQRLTDYHSAFQQFHDLFEAMVGTIPEASRPEDLEDFRENLLEPYLKYVIGVQSLYDEKKTSSSNVNKTLQLIEEIRGQYLSMIKKGSGLFAVTPELQGQIERFSSLNDEMRTIYSDLRNISFSLSKTSNRIESKKIRFCEVSQVKEFNKDAPVVKKASLIRAAINYITCGMCCKKDINNKKGL